MPLPPRFAPVVDALTASALDGAVSIDTIGDALGVMTVTTEDIESIFVALEARGLRVVAPEGQRGVANLRRVLDAARAIRIDEKRAATIDELAAHTGIAPVDVRHAIALGRVMGR